MLISRLLWNFWILFLVLFFNVLELPLTMLINVTDTVNKSAVSGAFVSAGGSITHWTW